MKKIFCTVIAGLFFLSNVFSQSIGMGTPTPSSSAQLDITSTTQGVLIPRMTTAGVTGISNPAKGLLVYDTVKNQLMVNMGTAVAPNWQTIVANSGWSLTGNNGTNPATQFLGTTDNQPLNIKVDNLFAGKIDNNLHNVLLGINSGPGITSGVQNSFVGDSAGYFTTTGNQNSFFGRLAGYSTTTPLGNSFIGVMSGYANTTGDQNSFLGYVSGQFNTTGRENCFLGTSAGELNSTGSYNTFLGSNAGRGDIFVHGTGNENVFIGLQSGYVFTSARNNVFVGSHSGFNTTTANQNTAIGDSTGLSNTTGNLNTYLGFQANAGGASFSNASAIGSKAMVSASNSMVLGCINGVNGATADTKIGIGTTTPAAKLHVSQGSFGGTYLFDDFIVEDDNSTYVNVLSPIANENGILFGLTDNAASGGIVYNNSATKKGLQFRTFNNTTKMVIDSIGNIGIGTQTPSYTFHVVNNNGGDGGFANGIVVENINASTGEAAISFKNTGATGTGSKLWIVGLNQDRNLDFNYGTSLAGANTKVVIDSTGNVGIGNLVPAEKLDITGNIKVNGNVTRPSTGAANMVPVCYGNVTSTGIIDSGTPNFSVTHTNGSGLYTITITSESYSLGSYSTIITPINIIAVIPVSFSSSGNLQVRLFNAAGTLTDSDFNFVVYKN